MILLDTDILTELMKARPAPNVEAWLGHQPAASLFITTITEAELRHAVALSPPGRRRENLAAAIEAMLAEEFEGRVLPFDDSAAIVYATIAADRQEAGNPISQFDAQIAAIAKSRGASLATRSSARFDGCGVEIINPWENK